MEISQVKINLKKLLKNKHISMYAASLAVGKEKTYIQQFINKPYPIRLPEDVRKKLAIMLAVSEQELTDRDLEKEDVRDLVAIDVVKTGTKHGMEALSNNIVGHHMISRTALREYTITAPDQIKIIKAVGDSMVPTINPNDIVWIDISIKKPTSDGLYLLNVGADLIIKRIQIDPFSHEVTIKSDNPNYSPIVRPNFDDIRVVGKVIYHMKRVG